MQNQNQVNEEQNLGIPPGQPLKDKQSELYAALGALYAVSVPSIERTAESYRVTKRQALEMARAALELATKPDTSDESGS